MQVAYGFDKNFNFMFSPASKYTQLFDVDDPLEQVSLDVDKSKHCEPLSRSMLKGAETDGIVLTGLTKSFGSLVAVNGVDLQMCPGQVFGLLGHNGMCSE